jgi:transposase
MLYAGLDLSRKRLDFHLLDGQGATVEVGAAPPDVDGLLGLTRRLDRYREPIRAAIESMNGARFVHDRLELAGWRVEIADAQKVKGLAPLACKTDRIDAWVLAELHSSRSGAGDLAARPAGTRRARASAVAVAPGAPPLEPEAARARRPAHARQALPGLRPVRRPRPPAARPPRTPRALATIEASLRLIDELEREIGECERELRRLGADHRYVPLLLTVPGIGWVLAYTIAAEIGDIGRFASPRKLAGYTGLCPRVYQSGERDLRGPLAKQGPKYLRWALVEAATHACTAPVYRDRYSTRKPASASSAAPRSPRSTSLADSPKRSGTCSPATNPSLPKAPPTPWPPDGP